MVIIKPAFLIYLITIVPLITIPLTYVIVEDQTRDNTLKYTIPYISNTINFPPESSIGAFGLTFTAIIGLAIISVRFCSIYDKFEQMNYSQIINFIAYLIGIVSFIGLIGLISFQIRSIDIVHIVFAYIFFIGSIIYTCFISLMEKKLQTTPMVRYIRSFLTILTIISALTCFIPSFWSQKLFTNISALGEICTTFFILLFLMTYYYEFRRAEIGISYRDYSRGEYDVFVESP